MPVALSCFIAAPVAAEYVFIKPEVKAGLKQLDKSSFKPSKIAAAIDSRSPDYSIEKHLSLGGHICGTSEENGHFPANIEMPSALKLAEKSAKSTTKQQATDGQSGVDKYVIPVVVHVYGDAHNCDVNDGICVTDEVIIDALNTSNEDFKGLNTLDGPIAQPFQAIRDNLNIEFVLASKDPDGNPTNGIVRHGNEVGMGNGGDNEVVMNHAWDNYKYMNIYVVNDLYGDGVTYNSGVAWYPNSEMSDKGLSRVVYNGSYLGKNANENFRSVLTHEFGHWLNLPHTFDGNDCHTPGQAFCESEGDKVCDTPQMSSSSMANNAPNCMGQPTNTENFMHYTNNYAMFTSDQVKRMVAALHHPSRMPLWSNENLTAAGLEAHIPGEGPAWDGTTGTAHRPEGEILLEQTDLAAAKDDVKIIEFEVPAGTDAISIYLDGFSQDPDLYVSHGAAPSQDENGAWTQDYVSFNAPDTDEAINILTPTAGTYYAAIHAYSEYSEARLSVVSVADTSSCGSCDTELVLEQKGLAANVGDEVKTWSVEVPDNAVSVSFEIAPGHSGDPDLHVSHNSVPQIDVADCLPWKAPGVRERCEFRRTTNEDGSERSIGGTYNILINPYGAYANGALRVHVTTVDANADGENTPPKAHTAMQYVGTSGMDIEFSSVGSMDIDGQIESFNWDFGDGNSADTANPVHNYAEAGVYAASLTVTDEDGATATASTEVMVNRQLDYCEASGDNSYDHIRSVKLGSLDHASNAGVGGYENFTAYSALVAEGANTITAMTSGPVSGDFIQAWRVWIDLNNDSDFEDDGEQVATFTAIGATSAQIDIPEGYKGLSTTMRIGARYKDAPESACGDIGLGEYQDYTLVVNSDPVAQINGPYVAALGNAVYFSSEGSNDVDGDLTYMWDFGDGATSTDASPAHTYQSAGVYEITLTVTDSLGASATTNTTATVVVPESPVVNRNSSGGGGSFGVISAFGLMLLGLRRRSK